MHVCLHTKMPFSSTWGLGRLVMLYYRRVKYAITDYSLCIFLTVQVNNWIWSQEIISYVNNACVAMERAYCQSTAYTLITCVIQWMGAPLVWNVYLKQVVCLVLSGSFVVSDGTMIDDGFKKY